MVDRAKVEELLGLLGLTLNSAQGQVFWEAMTNRITVMAGGEGAAKSLTGALLPITRGLLEGATLGWFMGADFEDARKELDYIIGGHDERWAFAEQLGILNRSKSVVSAHYDRMSVIYLRNPWSGQPLVLKTVSGYDPLKIGRDQPDFIIGCEVSRWPQELWLRAFGRLERKRGAWGFFSGSFDTSIGPFAEYYALGLAPNEVGIVSYSVPTWDNVKLYPGGYNDPAIQREVILNSPERFAERFGGKPAPPRDAVLPEFRHIRHIRELERDPRYPVLLFVDPGTTVYAVLFAQIAGAQVRVLDEVYTERAAHDQVVQECVMKELWGSVREGIIDVAGRQIHGGLMSPVQAWAANPGLGMRSQYIHLDATIDRLRSLLAVNPATSEPFLVIDPKCRGLISEMGGGPSPVRGGGMWRMQGSRPAPRNDHACKALAYGVAAYLGTVRPSDATSPSVSRSIVSSYIGRPDRAEDATLQEVRRLLRGKA